jgi:hypothetical protein
MGQARGGAQPGRPEAPHHRRAMGHIPILQSILSYTTIKKSWPSKRLGQEPVHMRRTTMIVFPRDTRTLKDL